MASYHAVKMATATQELRALELFVGAGGLALGTAQAGFKHIAAIDFYRPACETLRLNKRNKVEHVRDWDILEENIAESDFTEYDDIDLLSGGPPCQPFSQGGKRDGRSDSRDMFPEFIRAVRQCKPKSFIVENVKGLLNRPLFNYFNYVVHQLRFPMVKRKHGEKWKEHRARLEKLHTSGKYEGVHYNVIHQVLNATDFGLGQRRERVFIVGVRADLELAYSFPLATHTKEGLLYDQWVSGSYWKRHDVPKKFRPSMPDSIKQLLPRLEKTKCKTGWRTVRDEISDLPRIAIGRKSHKALNHFLNPGARTYHGHSGSLLDAPAKTLKAGHHGVPGGENMVRLDSGVVRYFSVRECARLQGFPDDWEFDGSWCGCMRQLGNAVPVSLAEVVATPLAAALRTKSK